MLSTATKLLSHLLFARSKEIFFAQLVINTETNFFSLRKSIIRAEQPKQYVYDLHFMFLDYNILVPFYNFGITQNLRNTKGFYEQSGVGTYISVCFGQYFSDSF